MAEGWVEVTYALDDTHLSQFCANHVQSSSGHRIALCDVNGRRQELVFGILDLKPKADKGTPVSTIIWEEDAGHVIQPRYAANQCWTDLNLGPYRDRSSPP